MKAIVYTQYGPPDVLQLREVAIPEPKDNQVLVKVVAAAVNALDSRRFENISFSGRIMEKLLFNSIDKVLGADIAGIVEAVGPSVNLFKPGDKVFGISAGLNGGFAEYSCAAEDNIALKPANIPFEAAASVPTAALTALQGLRDKGGIQPGQKVLINGASGGVGTFAVQIARSFGTEVTAVCSTRNLEIAYLIGADHVIDYSKEDFTKNGKRYDLIAAVNGYHTILDYQRALNHHGTYVAIGGSMAQFFQGILIGPVLSLIGSKKMGCMGIMKPNQKDLVLIKELLETNKVVPVIDRSYPFSETAEAIRYLLEGHATGKVVLKITPGPDDLSINVGSVETYEGGFFDFSLSRGDLHPGRLSVLHAEQEPQEADPLDNQFAQSDANHK